MNIEKLITQQPNNPFERVKVMRPCDESIKKTLTLVEDMLEVADEGDMARQDTGCGVLHGVLGDLN